MTSSQARRLGLLAVVGYLLIGEFATNIRRSRDVKETPHVRLVQFPRSLQTQFELERSTVPRDQILSGGPPKDGIPAISIPQFVSPIEATYLLNSDRVIGIQMDGDSRAYPLRILNYHEIVNDQVGEQPIAVTYCPLCDSAAVFHRKTPLGVREFGVSGLLYNSNVLMYDRSGQPESLWSQLKAEGITGPAMGMRLQVLPMELTTWQDWVSRHPDTKVLSERTGYQRNYRRNPYEAYFSTEQLMFPVDSQSNRLPAKTPVLGIWSDSGFARAYPISPEHLKQSVIRDSIDGKPITLEFDARIQSARVINADPSLHSMHTLWFSWHAFHPETSIYGDRIGD